MRLLDWLNAQLSPDAKRAQAHATRAAETSTMSDSWMDIPTRMDKYRRYRQTRVAMQKASRKRNRA